MRRPVILPTGWRSILPNGWEVIGRGKSKEMANGKKAYFYPVRCGCEARTEREIRGTLLTGGKSRCCSLCKRRGAAPHRNRAEWERIVYATRRSLGLCVRCKDPAGDRHICEGCRALRALKKAAK